MSTGTSASASLSSASVTAVRPWILLQRIPVLVIDVKGDLPNLALAFPSFAPELLLPWVDTCAGATDERPRDEIARE